MEAPLVTHKGGCHCGAVRFECDTPGPDVVAWDCNCSLCKMRRNTHFFVPKSRFRLLQGEDKLSTYTFNTGVAKHHFCSVCGVCSFYSPRSNPDCMSITIYCVDEGTLGQVEVKHFDGTNWEQAYAATGIGETVKEKQAAAS